ncbi:hypothetical protein LJ753_06030 [Arthrobacter sp. zg-Y20]|nr:hypothetical protein [Arthrobacter sp. zg-Y20]MCC3275427.1 hypothetical protein [Arthrobacter sp. zg-Y20]MDK1315584.1 hypothetical protein [Arthrobacter sp. zg.Y20]WIB05999.1 hypothetical protein QNO06_16005 [Arthrobacter sp. zg-Y20]
MKNMVRWIADAWVDHIWIDAFAACLILVGHVALVLTTSGFDFLGYASTAERRGLYSSAAIVVSLLGAFSGVVIGQAAAGKGDRMKMLKKAGGKPLADNWRSIYLAAITAAAASLAAMAIDVEKPGVAVGAVLIIRWVFEVALLYTVLKFLRLVVLFHPIIESSSLDDSELDEKLSDAAEVTPKWAQRRAG